MMSSNNEQPLDEAIQDFLNAYNLGSKLDEVKLINSWEDIVGKLVAKHTNNLYIRRKVLFVNLDSDALRAELSYSKSLLLQRLNEFVGKPLIKDIVFR
jgi:predicted nucleic acid-binding Zn ribbon protein